MRWTTATLTAAVVLAASSAGAQAPPQAEAPRVVAVRLEYGLGPGTGSCPGETFFRHVVAGHLGGRDPFEPTADKKVKLAVRRVRGGYEGVLEMFDAADTFRGKSSPVRDGSCTELIESMAAVVVPWVLPVETPKVEHHPEPPPPSSAPPSCPASSTPQPCPESRWSIWPNEWPMSPLKAPEPDPPQPIERWPVAIRLSILAGPEVVASGWGSVGIRAQMGVRYKSVSFGFELHGDPPMGTHQYPEGIVTFDRLTGGLHLCYHMGWFALCAVGDTGRIWFPNHVQALPPSISYSAVGAQAGAEIPIWRPHLLLAVNVDVLAPTNPRTFSTMRGTLFDEAGPSAGLFFGPILETPGW